MGEVKPPRRIEDISVPAVGLISCGLGICMFTLKACSCSGTFRQ
jgi:hypothetical protein